jgi:prepilin-type N-terminal cleavage/methylation domain-containing protein
MKRRGYTLVELIVSLAIITIIFTIGFMGHKIYKKISYEMEKKQLYYEIEDSLSYGKKYLCANNKAGIFCIEEKGDKLNISIRSNFQLIREVEFEKCISLYNRNYTQKETSVTLDISSNGNIESNTIFFQDKNGIRKILAVSVGENFTSLRDWEE